MSVSGLCSPYSFLSCGCCELPNARTFRPTIDPDVAAWSRFPLPRSSPKFFWRPFELALTFTLFFPWGQATTEDSFPMASSRIFVKGLPPALTEEEFRNHFAKQQSITDAKLLPHRRIGYVGYKTPEGAAKAIKYFNKSFIRTSRIWVEIARPASAPLVFINLSRS